MPTIGVAIALPEPWATQLQEYRTALGDDTATLIPTHITLVPPVELTEDTIDRAESHLADVAAATDGFCIHLRGTGTFRPVSPVVFVSLVEGISQCETLAERVRRGPLATPLQYPYHPHVTIAHHLPEPTLDRAFDELRASTARSTPSVPPLPTRRGERLATCARLRLRDGPWPRPSNDRRRGLRRARPPPVRRPRGPNGPALRDDEGQPPGRGGDVLRVPLVLPDPGARVLRRRQGVEGVPEGPGRPRHGAAGAVPGVDRDRSGFERAPASPASSAWSASCTPGSGGCPRCARRWSSSSSSRSGSSRTSCSASSATSMALGLIGLTLLVSVAVTGLVCGFATAARVGGLGDQFEPVVKLLAGALGFVATWCSSSRSSGCSAGLTPRVVRSVGAVLGAVGFEALKRLSFLLLASTEPRRSRPSGSR